MQDCYWYYWGTKQLKVNQLSPEFSFLAWNIRTQIKMRKQDFLKTFFGMQDFGIDFFSMGDLKVWKCYEVWRIWDAFFSVCRIWIPKSREKRWYAGLGTPLENIPLNICVLRMSKHVGRGAHRTGNYNIFVIVEYLFLYPGIYNNNSKVLLWGKYNNNLQG